MTGPEGAAGPVLAIDPGRDKCGLAIVTTARTVLYQAIVSASEVGPVVAALIGRHGVACLVVGDRTAAKEVTEALRRANVTLSPAVVDEHHSSEEGRRRYFQANPRRGWRRLLPTGLQTPARPYDDYVAVVLAERYLADRDQGPGARGQ